MEFDRSRSGTLTEYHHVFGISIETGNVFLDPFESKRLVQQPIVPARGIVDGLVLKRRVSHEPEKVEAVISRHKHNPVLLHNDCWIVHVVIGSILLATRET